MVPLQQSSLFGSDDCGWIAPFIWIARGNVYANTHEQVLPLVVPTKRAGRQAPPRADPSGRPISDQPHLHLPSNYAHRITRSDETTKQHDRMKPTLRAKGDVSNDTLMRATHHRRTLEACDTCIIPWRSGKVK